MSSMRFPTDIFFEEFRTLNHFAVVGLHLDSPEN